MVFVPVAQGFDQAGHRGGPAIVGDLRLIGRRQAIINCPGLIDILAH